MQSSFTIPSQVPNAVAVLAKYYTKNGNNSLARLLSAATVKVDEEVFFDNWNGGQHGHDVRLQIPHETFLDFFDSKAETEKQIKDQLSQIVSSSDEFILNVFLEAAEEEANSFLQPISIKSEIHKDNLTTSIASYQTDVVKRIWKSEKNFRVFLSHKSEFKKETSALAQKLSAYGISAFVAHTDIEPTKPWQNEIEHALKTMHGLVALISEGFHESEWTNQEIGYAMGRNIPIIPVKTPYDPRGFLGTIQAIPWNVPDLPLKLAIHFLSEQAMLDSYIDAVANSNSYDKSSTLGKLLPHIESLSEEQSKKLKEAYHNNSQIRDSYAFNGKYSSQYGLGLEFHLQRIFGKTFKL